MNSAERCCFCLMYPDDSGRNRSSRSPWYFYNTRDKNRTFKRYFAFLYVYLFMPMSIFFWYVYIFIIFYSFILFRLFSYSFHSTNVGYFKYVFAFVSACSFDAFFGVTKSEHWRSSTFRVLYLTCVLGINVNTVRYWTIRTRLRVWRFRFTSQKSEKKCRAIKKRCPYHAACAGRRVTVRRDVAIIDWFCFCLRIKIEHFINSQQRELRGKRYTVFSRVSTPR